MAGGRPWVSPARRQAMHGVLPRGGAHAGGVWTRLGRVEIHARQVRAQRGPVWPECRPADAPAGGRDQALASPVNGSPAAALLTSSSHGSKRGPFSARSDFKRSTIDWSPVASAWRSTPPR